MAVRGVFLSTRLSRKMFWGLLALTSTAFLTAGLGFAHITLRYQEEAARKVASQASRAFERGLLERLFAAEQVVKASGQHSPSAAGPSSPRPFQQMFRETRIDATPPARAIGDKAQLATIEVQARPDGGLDVMLHVPGDDGQHDTVASLADDYLWGHADTATLRMCVRPEGLASHCLGDALVAGRPVLTRTLNFEPFFHGASWEVSSQPTDEAEHFGPLGVGFVTVSFVALAVLLAAAGASIFLRRVTQALAALVGANRAAQQGQLASRIDTTGWKDELGELGASFNAMMDSLQTSFSYRQALQELDAAIVARKPLPDLLSLVRTYAAQRGQALSVKILVDHVDDAAHPSLNDGAGPSASQERHVPLAGAPYVARLSGHAAGTEATAQLVGELGNLAQRLVIAAQSYADQQLLVRQAATDSLTGLGNRFGFIESLQRAIDTQAWPALDVVYLDLNGFKEINDAFGHSAGDRLLCLVAERFSGVLKGRESIAARLGGDEFAFVLSRACAGAALADLQAAFLQPFANGAMTLRMHGSFGVARYPEDAGTVAELLRKADLAMYHAKNAGEPLACYASALESDAAARLALVEDLRSALASGQLTLVFQPRLQRTQPSRLSAEVLLRWRHPVLGMVPPSKFIPLAEEHALIDAIGDWVLAQACEQFAIWRDAGYPVAQLSVNVSPKQLLADDFFTRTVRLLDTWKLQDGAIELEVTEGALVTNVDKASLGMQRLREVGCHIAIDDFGVGFSALGYLHRLPFDTLKIDKVFVDEIHTKPASKAIATAIVALAKSLGKNVVAEGVELQEQVTVLESLQVDEFQGYFFSRPLSAEAFAAMLASHPCAVPAGAAT